MPEVSENKGIVKSPGWKNIIRLIVLMVTGTSMQYLVGRNQQVLNAEGVSISQQSRLNLS
ncbi:hypothetical protein [Maribellus sediminis]|uniref:hypothetical protein n=1 Tax=Maribellus sediminis TaxID=2696285 RepID=UPI00142FDA1C|nr:hypothetical protein [Maribellus sediminis]